jgi:hypothetical protein
MNSPSTLALDRGVRKICSDQVEHRRRLVEGRDPNRIGTPRSSAIARTYQPWDRERVVIDTATTGVEEAVAKIREAIPSSPQLPSQAVDRHRS